MTAPGHDADGNDSGFSVFVEGLTCPVDEFKRALVAQGMSSERADQVAQAIPCYVKTNVAQAVAVKFGTVFRQAGASVRIESRGQQGVEIGLPPAGGKQQTTERAWAPGPQATPEPTPAPNAPSPPGGGSGGSPAVAAPPFDLGPEVEPPAPDPGPATAAPPEIELPPLRPPDGATAPARDERDGIGTAKKETRDEQGGLGEFKKKKIDISAIPAQEEDPWLKRRYPHLIAAAILILVASYLYGCVNVMRKSSKLRSEIGDVNRLLENMNARGEVVTDDDIVEAVQNIGKRCGVGIARDQIFVFADPLGQDRLPGGVCKMGRVPDSFQLLPQADQQMILKSVQSCGVPDWILTIRVETKARWGLFSRTIYATKVTWVRSYEP